jgi:pimeloyl-ACP methyl ester carboxylesterase
VLLIIGDDDTTFIRAYVDMMEATVDDLTVEVLPGIGHWTSMQDPDKSTQAIAKFLADLKSHE